MNCTTKKRGMQPLSLAEIAQMEGSSLTPEDVAAALNCTPHAVRVMASTPEGRNGLGFPVIRIGSHTKIPRASFLRFMGWEGHINGVNWEYKAEVVLS